MNRWLIVIGIVFVLVGLAWPWVSKIPWGRLPGDFSFRVRGRQYHVPLASSVLLSLVAMAIGALF